MNDRIYYTVIDRTDGDCTEYEFESVDGATRWINELIEIFQCRAEDITAYARQYTKHGTYVGQERFFKDATPGPAVYPGRREP